MSRATLTLATLATLTMAAPAVADPVHEPSFTERFAQIFENVHLELVPRGLTEQLVRWQCAIRSLAFQTAEGLAVLAERSGSPIPALAILTTEPVERTESSGFGWRDDPIRHRPKFHSGTDFRGKRGTPVLAAGDGVVVFAGRRGGYGNMIDVDHGGGLVTRYAHLRRINAKRDTVVTAGQTIGQVGSTGRATGPHLHFEVRFSNRPVDPVGALMVAQLERESPEIGRIAAFALTPELQAATSSRVDPPKHRRAKPGRPDRPGRVKRVKPLS